MRIIPALRTFGILIPVALAVACDGWLPTGEPTPPAGAAKPSTEGAAADRPVAGSEGRRRLAALRDKYDRKREAAPADPDNPTVRCRTGGETLFTRRYDCIARNGRIL